MAKGKSRDRDRSRSKKTAASEEDFELTIADIERTGHLPDSETLQARHPGVQTHPVYKKEFRMLMIFRLQIQKYTYEQIAKALGMNVHSVDYYARQLKKATETDVGMITYKGQIGRSMAVYQDMQAQAYRMFSRKNNEMTDINKLRAIREISNLETASLRILDKAGFLKASKLAPAFAAEGGEDKPIDGLKLLIHSLSEPIPKKKQKVVAPSEETHVYDEDVIRVLT